MDAMARKWPKVYNARACGWTRHRDGKEPKEKDGVPHRKGIDDRQQGGHGNHRADHHVGSAPAITARPSAPPRHDALPAMPCAPVLSRSPKGTALAQKAARDVWYVAVEREPTAQRLKCETAHLTQTASLFSLLSWM